MVVRSRRPGARSRRIIFVNRFFYPDHSATSQILSDLAFALSKAGESVSVVTSRQRYDAPKAKLPARETFRGVDIHRISTTTFGRGRLAGRALDYLSFYLAAGRRLFQLARAGDVIIVKTDPPVLCIFAEPVARWRGAILVNWLQDLFPEVAEANGLARGRAARFAMAVIRTLRTRALRAASANIAIGRVMADRLARLGVSRDRITIIPNWADGTLIRPVPHEENPLRRAWGLDGKFVVGYSGNLGRAHDYATFLDAIAHVESACSAHDSGGQALRTPQIVWLFIGGGSSYDALRAEVQRRKLGSVRFEPYQPRERLAESLSAADIHLVSLSPEYEGLIVPSKFYGIAAAARATLFVGSENGELARMLKANAAGLTVPPGDGVRLAAAILQLAQHPERARQAGLNARAAFEESYDFTHAMAAWQKLLAELSEKAPADATVPSLALPRQT